MKRTLFCKVCAVVFGLGLVLSLASPVVAQGAKQKKKPSDRTVRVIMGWAFAGMPATLPDPKGKMIKLDLSDPKKYMIPLDDARRVIRRANMSAKADLCGLKDLERRHFKSIMLHEKALKKWTVFQMDYIQVLHATTSTLNTGSFAVGEDAKKDDDPSKDLRNTYKCSTEQRERWRAAVEADIKLSVTTQ